MPISMYQASIPHFVLMLGNLSSILDKTSAHTKAKKIDQGTFINARLAPDMYPLSHFSRYGEGLYRPPNRNRSAPL